MRGFSLFVLLFLMACLPLTDLPIASPSPSPSVTPTLSPYPTLAPTSETGATPSPAPSPAARFIGRARTRLNVRQAPLSSAEVLGILDAGARIEILAQDASRSWFLIVYPDGAGRGWVSATYVEGVNVDAIPLLDEPLALVLQPLNVRRGPGTNFESLGMLKAGDLVKALGKDASGAWIQIEYPAAADGKGWVNAAFLRLDAAGRLPLLSADGSATATLAPTAPAAMSTPTLHPARLDGDTQAAPLWRIPLNGMPPSRVILEDEVSAPQGDAEDWVRVEVGGRLTLQARLRCDPPQMLRVERWDDRGPAEVLPLPCNGEALLIADAPFWLRILEGDAAGGFRFTRYRLELQPVEQ